MSVWPQFEYELHTTSGKMFMGGRPYSTTGDALGEAITRAMRMDERIDHIDIVEADYDDYVM